jgi:hypothetical protein
MARRHEGGMVGTLTKRAFGAIVADGLSNIAIAATDPGQAVGSPSAGHTLDLS